MKLLLLLTLLSFFQPAVVFAEEISILVLHENTKSQQNNIKKINISEKRYSSFLNNSLKRALRKKQFKRPSKDFDLDYLVIGMSTDVRVGFFSWNLSSSSAVEYHLKVKSYE